MFNRHVQPKINSAGWVLSTDGVLTISGSGAMKNFSESNPAPWKVYASKIQSVKVEDGVTNVGDYAFDGLTEVTAFTLSTMHSP